MSYAEFKEIKFIEAEITRGGEVGKMRYWPKSTKLQLFRRNKFQRSKVQHGDYR